MDQISPLKRKIMTNKEKSNHLIIQLTSPLPVPSSLAFLWSPLTTNVTGPGIYYKVAKETGYIVGNISPSDTP